MKNDIRYRLDYGQYNSPIEMDSFCSTNCRFFSDCPGKGGFCSFIEQREMLSGQENRSIPLSAQVISAPQPFWSFPTGRGAVQPWRRKLWELKNKF